VSRRATAWLAWVIWPIVALQVVLIMLSVVFEALARSGSSSSLGLSFMAGVVGIAVSTLV
jgi:hypothetical protein